MDELKWNWVYVPYLDAPDKQKESAIKAGYAKVYFKSEADTAIAELKDKCQMHDFFWDGCGFAKRGFKNTIAVSEAFNKLEAENAELKAEIKRKEAVGQRWFERCMVERTENVRLKRALWLARALRARDKAFEYHFKNNVEMCAKWDNVHLMLMAKAEEYK